MRYLLFLVVLLALSISSVAAQDAAQETVIDFSDHPARIVSNINGLNMRSSPAIEADNIVGRLQPGQQVHVLTRDGAWQQVRSEDGLVGWSHSDYLINMQPRQLGETRLFRIKDEIADSSVLVNADLRHIGQHSYIYVAEHPRQDKQANLGELRAFAKAFDEYIYPETYALWDPDPKPNHEGDERIVILVGVGYEGYAVLTGSYHSRGDMPGELYPNHNRIGFIFIEMSWRNDVSTRFLHIIAAHELQHLIQHHFDVDETSWVNEGLSVLTSAYLDYSEWDQSFIPPYQDQPYSQLYHTPYSPSGYGPGFLFTTYILEQLGLEALRAFAAHPARGFAGLDAVLANLGLDFDVDSFFADWALANYLFDDQLGDGEYGYPSLNHAYRQQPSCRDLITQLPAQFHSENNPYATEYYELPLPAGGSSQKLDLELQLLLANPHPQDAWLQWVEVRDGQVDVQRFRASEFRGRTMKVTLHEGVEHAFIALSPFTPSNRNSTTLTRYTLSILTREGGVSWSDTKNTLCIPFDADSTTQLRAAAAALERMREERGTAVNSSSDATEPQSRPTNDKMIQAIRNHDEERVEQLLSLGADINGNFDGHTPVVYAVKLLNHSMVTRLLAAGADPDIPTHYSASYAPPEQQGQGPFIVFGGGALLYAVFDKDIDLILLLLAAGADPNLAYRHGRSALHLAAGMGHSEMVEILLDAGADPALGDNTWNNPQTPADFARKFGHLAVAEMIEVAAQ